MKIKWLLAGLVFFLPTNLFFKLSLNQAYVNGLLVDYLIPKFYVSDLFMLGLLLVALRWMSTMKRSQILTTFTKHKQMLILGSILLSLLGFRQLWSINPTISLAFFIKAVMFGAVGWWLSHHRQILRSRIVLIAVTTTIIFQAGVGFYQFYQQQSVAGYLFFGEANFSHTIGLAKTSWHGAELILPYGTTAHPNILAGSLMVYWLILVWTQWRRLSQAKFWLLLVTGSLTAAIVWLTQSFSAGLVGVVAGLLLVSRHPSIVISMSTAGFLLMPIGLWCSQSVIELPSISRRVMLNTASLQLLARFPILGSGLNTFTLMVEKVSQSSEIVRFVQPAHHLGLLWLAETGALGMACFMWVVAWLKRNLQPSGQLELLTKVALLLPIASLDHYLLSLQSGWLLILLWLCWPLKLPNDR